MSRIKKDIERYMEGPTRIDAAIVSTFMFPAEFIGFQGHFPTNKVLPGACQVQCALTTIEKAEQRRVDLKEIVLAKYIAPVFPGDSVVCTVNSLPAAGSEYVYKARITKGTEKVSELKLRISLGAAV